MNYRCGFQRLYAALTVVWIASALLVIPSDRLKFWSAEAVVQPPPGKGNIFDQVADVPRLKLDPQPEIKPPPGATLVSPKDAPATLPPDFSDRQEKEANSPASATERALWLVGVVLAPPAAGYGAFFLVIPWIYRGFRPVARI